jgi:hypothetical protein
VIFYEPKNRGCAADFFLKGQDNSMVGGFIFFSFFFLHFKCFVRVGREPKRASFRPRIVGYITHCLTRHTLD